MYIYAFIFLFINLVKGHPDFICLDKTYNFTDNGIIFKINSYYDHLIVNRVREIEDAMVSTFKNPIEKEVFMVFVKTLMNYNNLDEIKKQRIRLRIQEMDFKLQATSNHKSLEQMVFEFAKKVLKMIESNNNMQDITHEKIEEIIVSNRIENFESVFPIYSHVIANQNISVFQEISNYMGKIYLRYNIFIPSFYQNCKKIENVKLPIFYQKLKLEKNPLTTKGINSKNLQNKFLKPKPLNYLEYDINKYFLNSNGELIKKTSKSDYFEYDHTQK